MKRPDFSATSYRPYDSDTLPMPAGDFWVFAYGSLMWNPGFEYCEALPARLYGYHRRLCLWSVHYRGTVENPGLVLGLDRGGSCSGMAFRVAGDHIGEAVRYLKQREMLNNAYLPAVKNVYPRTGGSLQALTFVSRTDHPQFAQPMTIEEIVSVVMDASGERGQNCEYVLNTVEHLEEFGVFGSELHAVARRILIETRTPT